jgi:hypothetical protein
MDTSNRQAKDDWYRDLLWSTCKIRTSKDADARAFRLLVSTLKQLSQAEPPKPELIGVTDAQNRIFQMLVAKAWQCHCRHHADDESFHHWLDRHLSSIGIVDRTVTDKVGTFDTVLHLLATLARDLYWIDRTSQCAERRLRYQIRLKMSQISDVTKQPCNYEYVSAIYRQANLMPIALEDATTVSLFKLLQMLDTHLRRLQSRREISQLDVPERS